MFSLSTSVVVLAGLVSNCLAFPTRFNGGCYVPDGRRVMGNAASTDTNVCKLVYSGAGTLDKYIPGQSYQFKVTGPNGKSILLGSDHGTWTGGDATCSSNGQKGVIGNFKSELVATWTAPSTAPGAAGGRVKIGGTCGNQGGVNTHELVFAPVLPKPCATSSLTFGNTVNTGCDGKSELASGSNCDVDCKTTGQVPTEIITCKNGNFNATSDVACEEYDACVADKCTNNGETCQDIVGGDIGASGRKCFCENANCNNNQGDFGKCLSLSGSLTIVGGEGPVDGKCQEIDACVANACPGDNTKCVDVVGGLFSDSGRRCECKQGYATQNGECEDIDACIDNTCGTDAQCKDRAAPAGNTPSDRVCTCDPGFEMVDGKCDNVDACIANPCFIMGVKNDDRCVDDVSSSDPNARSCKACGAGFQTQGDDCLNIDACLTSPCNGGAGETCEDLLPGDVAEFKCNTPVCTELTQITTTGLAEDCTTCPDGQEPNPVQTQCNSCPLGKAGIGGDCDFCEAGTQPATDPTRCVDCPEGAIRAKTSVAGGCVACLPKFFTTDALACQICTKPGYNVVDNACVECEAPQIGVDGVCADCEDGLVRSSSSECVRKPTEPETTPKPVAPPITSDNFCKVFSDFCGPVGVTYTACEADFPAFMGGAEGATQGNTQACRIYHLGVAAQVQPEVHCLHAAQDGGGVCVSQPTPSDFCNDYVDTCGDVGWQDADECVADAGKFVSGAQGATGGNTFGCRVYHLGVAKKGTDTAAHCGHASAGGLGVCVGAPDASDFCADYSATCDGYPECDTFYGGLFEGADGAVQGNTKACRAYHLGVAKVVDPDVHCPHASKDGAGVCVGTTAQDFCTQYFATCPQSIAEWEDVAKCVAAYGGLATGAEGDTGGNSQSCRSYHLGVAMQQDTTLHCGHAGKSGDGVCVAVAITDKTFCSEFASVCGPEGVAAYDDCATDFAAMAKGETGATGGDNQECRMYHLGVARTTDTKFHCGHASSTGEGVCIPEAITADNFCSVFDEVCADESVAYSDCAADFTTHAVGNAGAVGGDSQECRIYHLGVARSTDASVHCPHAAKDGDGVCAAQTAVTSTNFCTKFDSICGSITTPYTNCSNDFAAFDSGDSDEEGDTQTCRIYYLGLAATNDTSINCANAAEKGGTTCAADTASSDSSISSLDVFSYTNAATEFIVTFVIAFVLMEYFLYVKVVEEFKPNTKSNDSSTDDDVEANQGKNKNKNKKEIVEFEVKKENPILDLNESGYLEVDEPKKAEPEREEAYGF